MTYGNCGEGGEYLFIDTSVRDTVSLSLYRAKTKNDINVKGSIQEFLEIIDKFIIDQGLSKSDIRGIVVVVGEGSFTSTRLAMVIANTFGYTQNIPLLAILRERVKNLDECILDLLRQPLGQYISATYSAIPSIDNMNA